MPRNKRKQLVGSRRHISARGVRRSHIDTEALAKALVASVLRENRWAADDHSDPETPHPAS